MVKPQRGDKLQIHIDRLSVGGRGVARHEGLVIFVPFVAPNEDIEVELTMVKKNYAEAKLISIVKASPSRVTPPCPVAGICGGCSWQQVAYDEQLRQKRSLVRESIKKFSGYDVEAEESVLPAIASPNEFRYRNRIQLHHAGPKMGFFKRGTHEIVDINDCPITEEAVAAQIPEFKRELASAKPGRIELLISSDGSIGTRQLGKASSELDGEDAPETTGPAFAQVNTAQNEKLVESVVNAVRALGAAPTIYDLYAGSGNFTFALAKAMPQSKLIAVEMNHESVARGREMARKFKSPIKFEEGDVATYLRSQRVSPGSIVVLDPPRTGCGPDVMEALAVAKPRHILYVSCHPVTLARDLRLLKDAVAATADRNRGSRESSPITEPAIDSEYQLTSVQPFDMFPQTDHVETLVHLTLL